MSNVAIHSGTPIELHSREEEMRCFDALPPSLRRAVAECPTNLSARAVSEMLKIFRTRSVVKIVRRHKPEPYEVLMRRQTEAAAARQNP